MSPAPAINPLLCSQRLLSEFPLINSPLKIFHWLPIISREQSLKPLEFLHRDFMQKYFTSKMLLLHSEYQPLWLLVVFFSSYLGLLMCLGYQCPHNIKNSAQTICILCILYGHFITFKNPDLTPLPALTLISFPFCVLLKHHENLSFISFTSLYYNCLILFPPGLWGLLGETAYMTFVFDSLYQIKYLMHNKCPTVHVF